MILIDTTPLVALCDARDRQHRTALKHLEALSTAVFCTCEAVLMETCFHLPHRAQRARLRAVLDSLQITPLSGSGDGFWFEVLEWLVKYADHEPDWGDGCIAVLSGHHASLKVWTYDRRFRTTWRKPNGALIPMAPI